MANARIASLALCALLLTPSSWAADEQPSARERLHLMTSPESITTQTMQTLLHNSVMLSLRPTVFTPPLLSGRLKDLTPDSDSLRSQGLAFSSSWRQGKLKTESEMAVVDGAQLAAAPQPDMSRRMTRLVVTGTEGAFRYGATYRTAGGAYVESGNQSLREVWGEYAYGIARLRTAAGQTWNNVNGDPTQPRVMQTYNRLGLSLDRPHWPELTLTYSRASLWNGLLSGVPPLQRATTDSLEAAFSYARPTWQMRLASSYIVTKNELAGTRDTTGFMETLSASFRPWNTLSIVPSVGYRADADQWSGARIETPSASFSLHYRATPHVFLSAWGGYSSTHAQDGTVDLESLNSRALVAWSCPALSFPIAPTILAFEAGYTRTADHSAAVADVSGLLRLIVEEL
jgi:hypothetical protein